RGIRLTKHPHAGFLHVPHKGTLKNFCDVPYFPQPGDMLFYDDKIPLHHIAYKVAGTDAPTHASIAFEAPDHHTVLLELTGPRAIFATVQVMEADPRLRDYSGRIIMRRLRQPLLPEQSAALTDFALAQEGKGFATGRGLLQLTPFRARFGLRRCLFAHTYFDRCRWLCSELVVAAATAAGVLDCDSYPANAIYPRDLAFDETIDLSSIYEPPVEWRPECGMGDGD